jgi:hypothetical protein
MNNNNFINNSSFLLQLYSVMLLIQDFNNTDLMQELQNQDSNYLQKIINQNEQIIDLLRKEDNNARKVREEN